MANTYLGISTTSSGTRTKWTASFWVKRSNLLNENTIFAAYLDNDNKDKISFNSDGTLQFASFQAGSYSNGGNLITERVFRDANAWYHIVCRWDSNNSTANNRMKIWVNGEEMSDFSSRTNPTSGRESLINYQQITVIGRMASNYLDGCLSHVHFCDNQLYQASDFGETDATTGEWKIKTSPSVSYGTTGYFALKDGNSLTDQSGLGNNLTLQGGIFTKTESSPSNVFATWNPLLPHAAGGYTMTYSYGNNNIVFGNATFSTFTPSTLGASTGKYYFESKISNAGSGFNGGAMTLSSISTNQTSGGFNDYVGKNTNDVGYQFNGEIVKNSSSLQTGLTSVGVGDILGVAMDLDNNTIQFYVNGASSGNAVSLSADETYFFAFSGRNSAKAECNFGNGYFADNTVATAGTNASGNGIFEFDVPTGFTALSTKGLNL